MPLEFARDGAELCPGLAKGELASLDAVFERTALVPGMRLDCLGALRKSLDHDSPIGACVSKRLGAPARPVRGIAFDKSVEPNWALGWHQDRVIAVRDRVNVAGFGPWTVKQGQHHVQPPAELLARMATVRIHLDAVDAANAPLKIAVGSHKFGRVEVRAVAEVAERCQQAVCFAEAGDVWIYATLILHGSDRSASRRRRRVLQIDYAAEDLPGGLKWQLS